MSVPGLTEATLTVGMPVVVFRYGRGNPEPVPGEITKIGRTLVTIATGPHRVETAYRLDGQGENMGNRGGVGGRFLTDAQVAEQDLRNDALARLRTFGLVPGDWHAPRLTLDTVTLVRMADLLPEQDPT